MNISDFIFNHQDDSLASLESLILPITDQPCLLGTKPKNVPMLNLNRLAPRKDHYFSKSTDRVIDLSAAKEKNQTLKMRYNLASPMSKQSN